MLKRKMVVFLMLIILSVSPIAEAATGYATNPVYTDIFVSNYSEILFNHTTLQEYVIADTSKGDPPTTIDPGVTLTSISFKFDALWADTGEVYFYDWQNNNIGIIEIDLTGTQPIVVTPPSGTYAAKAWLFSSNVDGRRWLWFHSLTNSAGNTVIFPDPDMPVDPSDPSDPGDGTNGEDVLDKLDQIISNQDVLISKGEAIKDNLGEVVSRLDTANGHLNAIRSDVNDLRGYIMTPRDAEPLSTDNLLPAPVIDPTPPKIEEPYQQPYRYNRTQPAMHPFEDSPGPLPINPEPYIMPHDPVAEKDQPLAVDTPKQRDIVIKDPPLTLDPAIVEEPRQRDPVILDKPLQRDPVVRDAPIIPDEFHRDEPISSDQPLSRENPLLPDALLQRDEPITRDDPIILDPPMN